ncbi:hypothetical protein ASC78_08575 [Variovorax sp. Root318D1]|uniref:hypothetical protein n=1 Tax=Variovorax sp. Root318D1 TaxID=1736513 RepID=UPI0006FCB59C|nr:hypothetical protein [Variovorax sp. Root318D1]KQU84554.1 hypothetical protein ASC78_08575 [Variovorax sp. Root318D1]
MVGIVQPDDYSIFIRKIGYSVGLEQTLDRVIDFCEVYASRPQIKPGDWLELVFDKWDLKSANIADVFGALGFVTVKSGAVYPGLLGEAGALCVKQLDKTDERRRALQRILALAVLLADGDIFVNALIAGFEPEATADLLVKMVSNKRHRLFEMFTGQHEREAISSVVTIERQRQMVGTKKPGIHRSEPLVEASRKLGLPAPKDVFKIDEPSPTYLRHMLTPRREWARSFGFLTDRSCLSERGWSFLRHAAAMGFVAPGGECDFLPTKVELERARLSQFSTLYQRCPETADYVRLIGTAFGTVWMPAQDQTTAQGLATLTRKLFMDYRELSQDRRLLRNELPYLTAIAAHMALAPASEETDYATWLRENEWGELGVKVRSSRTIELGIIVN